MRRRHAIALASAILAAAACSNSPAPEVTKASAIKPVRGTEALPFDPDDPAIWLNKTDSALSIIFGKMKVAAPNGGLAVFGVDG